jgi:photosystem II stability/assembly factor-like uncharacterized protein
LQSVQIVAAEQNEASVPVKFASTVSNPSGLSLQYAWNFGDGQTGSGENAEHLYASSGDYQVTLTVSSPAGSATSTLPIRARYSAGVAGMDCVAAAAGTGWCRQSYLPTNQHLTSVKMVDKNVIWALGWGNTVVRSVDGGTTWFTKRIQTSSVLKGITAVSATDAWVVGTSGFESHTADGGATWRSGGMPAGAKDFLAVGVARDGRSLWITGDDGTIFRSTDGGANWADQSLGPNAYMCTLWSVSVVDSNSAWAAGPACIARTTDGGQHWIQSDGFNVGSVSAVDANTAWIVATYGVQKTTDGGKTWKVQLANLVNGTGVGPQFTSVSAVDANTIFVSDYSGFIMKSADGGLAWRDYSPPASFICCFQPNFNAISAADGQNSTAVGANGAVYVTRDGVNWISQNKGAANLRVADIQSIAVFDAGHAIVAPVGLGQVFRTGDGGRTWLVQESPRSLECSKFVAKINATSAISVGCGWAHDTNDQGKTWKSSYVGNMYLNAASVSGEGTVWAAGEHATIAYRKSGGSWNVVATNMDGATLRAISVLDDNVVWAVGDYGTVMRTVDGGKTWGTQSGGSISEGFGSIVAVDANTAWATQYPKSVVLTRDGGKTWSKVDTGVPEYMVAVATLDGKVLWAAGQKGKIVRSEDGGKTWSAQDSGTADDLYAIRLIDNNTAWVVGANGTILKTATAGK